MSQITNWDDCPLLMNPEQLANLLSVTTQRLAVHRMNGTGPAFTKEGRKVLYLKDDVRAWLLSNRRERTEGDGK